MAYDVPLPEGVAPTSPLFDEEVGMTDDTQEI